MKLKLKQPKLLLVFIATFLIVAIYSCKKTDVSRADNNNEIAVQKFFSLPAGTNPEIQNLANDLKKQNSLVRNLPDFISQNGMPRWDKVHYKVNNKSGGKGARTSGELEGEKGVFFVPLQSTTSDEVKSYITCYKTNDSLYFYRLYNKDSLESVKGQTDSSKTKLMNTLAVFGYFERTINNKSSISLTSPKKGEMKNANISFGDNTTGGKLNKTRTAGSREATEFCSITIEVTIEYEWRDFTYDYGGAGGWYAVAVSVDVTIACFSYDSGGGAGGGGSTDNWSDYGTGWPYYDPWSGEPASGPNPSGYYDPYDGWYPWFTSVGDYRVLDGVIYTPNDFPGKDWGYPWLWWENQITSNEIDPNVTDNDPNLIWWDENISDPNTVYTQQPKPNWQKVYDNYPKNVDGTDDLSTHDVCVMIGGQVLAEHNAGNASNACALRVSRALNYSGVTIPYIAGQTWQGADGKNYFYYAEHLYNWLTKTFGQPDIHLTAADGAPKGTKFPEKLVGIQNRGIYIMKPTSQQSFHASGHATLWGGLNCIGGHNYFPAASDIYIWKLPQ